MIFADTSFWVALRNRRDAHHQDAAALLGQRADEVILTTNHVVGETWTYLRRRAGHVAGLGFLDVIGTSPRTLVHHVSEAEEERSLAWLRQHDERKYSFVDATSFTTMTRAHLHEALAFDGDFSAAGFVEVRP